MKLLFKKAFGIDTVPAEAMMWLNEMEDRTFAFVVDKTPVSIAKGTLGNTEMERREVERFLPAHHAPFAGLLPTLDVEFSIDGAPPLASWLHTAADALVEPHITTAFHAVRAFAETYRDCKYVRYRKQERWTKRQTVIPHVSEHEFRTLLFYVLDAGDGASHVGVFCEGTMIVGERSGGGFPDQVQSALAGPIPTERKFLVMAWEYLFDEDFSGAVIYSAISIERAMTNTLRAELSRCDAGSQSQIGKVVDDTSKRLLCTVLLGAFGIGDQTLRERMATVFEVRNALAHGNRHHVSRKDAEDAVRVAEAFLELVSGRPALNTRGVK